MQKNYMTRRGAEQLKSELKQLLTQDRPALVKTVEWAASNGDRSENADYIYGKRRLREMDRRIRFLSQRLEKAEIIDPSAVTQKDRVLFGATVKVEDDEGKERVFRIVGQDEIDLKRGWISWVSPIGKALLNSRVGDLVQCLTPGGAQEFEVIEIVYTAEGDL